MWIKKSELAALADLLARAEDGKAVDFRDNSEGALSILKNELHTFTARARAERDAANQTQTLFAEFMENISHQLKTPVTSLLLMADLVEDAPREKQEEFLANMRTSLMRMNWLVDTLLKMAKLDAGAVQFERAPVAVQALVEAATVPLAILLEVREQTLVIEEGGVLHCDQRWTTEALTNLIKNACEASPVGSVISVSAGDNPLYEWVAVRDAGPGLSRDAVATLFTRFASDSDQGVGIGLPLALAIARGQHGDIEVDAGGKGSGATFTLKLYK
ncbi:MAG: HAMP domain-containing sensor histidine kinase [Peptococcaceae bacterium]|nr:HAMP domain-containing sensor histidine kinase [Peptococcaceae bacterium]